MKNLVYTLGVCASRLSNHCDSVDVATLEMAMVEETNLQTLFTALTFGTRIEGMFVGHYG